MALENAAVSPQCGVWTEQPRLRPFCKSWLSFLSLGMSIQALEGCCEVRLVRLCVYACVRVCIQSYWTSHLLSLVPYSSCYSTP